MSSSNDAAELAEFKRAINLTEYAASTGYELDKRESSRNSAVMRHPNGDKIIIACQSDNWVYFSVRDDDDNGSIIDFVMRREAGGIGRTRQTLRQWIGNPPPTEPCSYAPTLETSTRDRAGLMRRFLKMSVIQSHSALTARGITADLLTLPRFSGCVLQDERKNACFPHYDRDGIAGWEMKNRGFTGFAAGGSKGLWFSRTKPTDARLVIAEGALDALSYAALFPDEHTRYFSTGGSLNPDQPALIRAALAKMPAPAALILATDNDEAGNALAATIQSLAPPAMDISRPLPTTGKDWNDQLRAQTTPTDALGRPQGGLRDFPLPLPTPKTFASLHGPENGY